MGCVFRFSSTKARLRCHSRALFNRVYGVVVDDLALCTRRRDYRSGS